MSLISVSVKLFIAGKYLCKASQNIAKEEQNKPTFLLLFSGSLITKYRYTDKKIELQMSGVGPNTFYWLAYKCPHGEFLPHLMSFYPAWRIHSNSKNVRNTIIIANTNSLIGRKILPPKNYPLQKCVNLSYSFKCLLFAKS